MRKKQAEKLFCDAMDALAKVGESPLNYCLSYARGFMAAENKKEYLHEWEDGTMRLKVSDGEQVHLMERNMDESRKQFLEWWRHPEQEELRKSCAEGWGEKIWSASRSAIAIELPAKNDISSDDYSIPDMVDWGDGRNAGIQECAEAIRDAGIKVKG